MKNPALVVFFVAAMIAVIVGADLAFFRFHFWLRLAFNVGVVVIFLAFYFVGFGHPSSPRK